MLGTLALSARSCCGMRLGAGRVPTSSSSLNTPGSLSSRDHELILASCLRARAAVRHAHGTAYSGDSRAFAPPLASRSAFRSLSGLALPE
jgi:hypothetical protein